MTFFEWVTEFEGVVQFVAGQFVHNAIHEGPPGGSVGWGERTYDVHGYRVAFEHLPCKLPDRLF